MNYKKTIIALLVIIFIGISGGIVILKAASDDLDPNQVTHWNNIGTQTPGRLPITETLSGITFEVQKRKDKNTGQMLNGYRWCASFSQSPINTWSQAITPCSANGTIGNFLLFDPSTWIGGFWDYINGPSVPLPSQCQSGSETSGNGDETAKQQVCRFTACNTYPDYADGPTYGQDYGLFITGDLHPKGVSPAGTQQRSNVLKVTWGQGADNVCIPPTHYSCVSSVGSSTTYCSADATGTYTTSSCDGNCAPAGPSTRYTCSSKQCLIDINGPASSCEEACGAAPTNAKAPVITDLKPTTAPPTIQIEVDGSDLGTHIKLKSVAGGQVFDALEGTTDNSKTVAKFDLIALPVGEYTASVSGWGSFESTWVQSPKNITIKEGGSDFQGAPVIGIPTGYKSLGELITFIFAWSLRLLGITVFVMIFYAGVIWMTAHGDTGQVGDAKKRMTNAVLGAILLLSAYLILYTINPNLVGGEFTLPGIGTTPTQTTP